MNGEPALNEKSYRSLNRTHAAKARRSFTANLLKPLITLSTVSMSIATLQSRGPEPDRLASKRPRF